VGSDQIKSPWLDEGLASFLQEKIFYPDMESLRKKIEVDYQRLSAMPALSYKLSDDLSVYKNWSDYYNVQYAKSKIMLYTLNAKMGEENFSKFIKEYYSNYSFKIAQPSDFIKTAEDVYGESLQDFFDTWLYGEKLPPLYF
jgi:aminopeptidase N